MEPSSTPARTLSTAEQRREELVQAAVRVFARDGYAAPTTAIAKQAGISQAYLFRLFPSKEDLFAAANQETSRRMFETFEAAAREARASGEDPLEAMGKAYGDLLERDRDVLLVQLHCQVAAAHSEDARAQMHDCYSRLYALVSEQTGAGPEELRTWFAYGMLCNTMAAIDADRTDEPWARALAGSQDCAEEPDK